MLFARWRKEFARWSFVFGVRCLWRHNLTLFPCFQTNVLAKFVDIKCIFLYIYSLITSCLDVELTGRVFFCSDNWVPATRLPKGQNMDARNTRSRKVIETLSQAVNEPTLKDLHAMLLCVIQRLDSIENDLLKRMTAVEESVENAHYNFTAMSV